MRSLTSRVRLDLDQVLNRDVYEAKLGPKKSTEFNPRPTLFKWDPGKLPHVFTVLPWMREKLLVTNLAALLWIFSNFRI